MNQLDSEYYAYTDRPYLTVQEAMQFLDEIDYLIRQDYERGRDPRQLMQIRKTASDYIHCHFIWASP
jgi:hypothetical protein